jgi:two-component system chemotaxis response regulator CheY
MEPCSIQPVAVDRAALARASVTALIVDDEAHVRSYLRLVLSSLGVKTVWEAVNGREGLQLYQLHQPTVVLLDLNLPIMSGDEVMEALTKLDPSAAVIVVTAQNELETVKRFIRLGAMGYVLKYLPQERIVATLGDMLSRLIDQEEQSA